MSLTITDADVLARLLAGDSLEVKDGDGRTVGRVLMDNSGKLPPGVRSPLTEAEIDARFAEPAVGRPLSEILRDLQARG